MKSVGQLAAILFILPLCSANAGRGGSAEDAYASWKEDNPKEAAAPHHYLSAAAHREGERVVVTLGVAGYLAAFQVSARPARAIRQKDGSVAYETVGQEAGLLFSEPEEHAEALLARPKFVVAAPAEAEVLEIMARPAEGPGAALHVIVRIAATESEGPTAQAYVSKVVDPIGQLCPNGCFRTEGYCTECGPLPAKCCRLTGDILLDCVRCKLICQCGSGI